MAVRPQRRADVKPTEADGRSAGARPGPAGEGRGADRRVSGGPATAGTRGRVFTTGASRGRVSGRSWCCCRLSACIYFPIKRDDDNKKPLHWLGKEGFLGSRDSAWVGGWALVWIPGLRPLGVTARELSASMMEGKNLIGALN